MAEKEGRPEEALALAREALENYERLGMRKDVEEVRELLGRLAAGEQ